MTTKHRLEVITSLNITQMTSNDWTGWPYSDLQWPGTATADYRSHEGRVWLLQTRTHCSLQ